ncbi:hypothetical protein NA56DRAFT_743689 [Hyaloscypha hepaticicola]|uniref:Uncharacterized protein n=1 Tax=Hyaloscypha hepaticicola TaxID=2082293 RepID=A0A2J6QM61_9HELO|nr:hypothetical protein NA56DRAFT_743689 [Hyaloscypha hepaticicola]
MKPTIPRENSTNTMSQSSKIPSTSAIAGHASNKALVVMERNRVACVYMTRTTIFASTPRLSPTYPSPFYRLSKEDHQDLYNLANNWLKATNTHLLARMEFQASYPGAWHLSEGPHDHRTTSKGHLTKLNIIKQEICAVTGRLINHLTWRDKELYESRGNTSISLSHITYPGHKISTSLHFVTSSQLTTPSCLPSPLPPLHHPINASPLLHASYRVPPSVPFPSSPSPIPIPEQNYRPRATSALFSQNPLSQKKETH